MTCKEHCLHLEVCKLTPPEYATAKYYTFCNCAEKCECFKDKSKYIELPCKVGDTAYFIWNFDEPEIQECEVKEFRLEGSSMYVLLSYIDCIGHHEHSKFLMRNLNKSWFLIKSEAEAKLKELNENAE